MQLHTIWFVIITVLWIGFFVLEGFDFGVGALHQYIGKTEIGRRVCINTIGPWWDGNEVWLVGRRRVVVRGVPGVVRDDVLGAVPGARARSSSRCSVAACRSSGGASATIPAGSPAGRGR